MKDFTDYSSILPCETRRIELIQTHMRIATGRHFLQGNIGSYVLEMLNFASFFDIQVDTTCGSIVLG
jgi:hypothetical protein